MSKVDAPRSTLGIGGAAWRLALAPWAPLLVIALIGTVPFSDGDLLNVATEVFWRSVFVGVWLSLFAVLFGTPLYLIYRRLGWTAWWAYSAGAAALVDAILAALILSGRPSGDYSYSDSDCNAVIHSAITACGAVQLLQTVAVVGLLGAAFGAICGFSFWAPTKLRLGGRHVRTQRPAG